MSSDTSKQPGGSPPALPKKTQRLWSPVSRFGEESDEEYKQGRMGGLSTCARTIRDKNARRTGQAKLSALRAAVPSASMETIESLAEEIYSNMGTPNHTSRRAPTSENPTVSAADASQASARSDHTQTPVSDSETPVFHHSPRETNHSSFPTRETVSLPIRGKEAEAKLSEFDDAEGPKH